MNNGAETKKYANLINANYGYDVSRAGNIKLEGKIKMSKIKKILKDEESVLVFDVDGVLAIMEWGEYNHFNDNDEEWNKMCEEGINTYTEDKVSKKMQNFLKDKDTNRIYVITTIGTDNELKFKKNYVEKYYNIPKENVYYVENNNQKIKELKKIKENYPKLEDYKIIMIDDTTEILTDIMENTDFSTAHISSFLDI